MRAAEYLLGTKGIASSIQRPMATSMLSVGDLQTPQAAWGTLTGTPPTGQNAQLQLVWTGRSAPKFNQVPLLRARAASFIDTYRQTDER